MSQKGTMIAAGAIALLGLIVGLSGLSAQRFAAPGGETGRYVVVRATPDIIINQPPTGRPGTPSHFAVRPTPDIIILLDTVTGDLYNAVPSDIKPYGQRSRSFMDRPLRDKESSKDKDRFREFDDKDKDKGGVFDKDRFDKDKIDSSRFEKRRNDKDKRDDRDKKDDGYNKDKEKS